jgi:hypothetical protein
MSLIGGEGGLKPIWKESGGVRVDHRFLWLLCRTLDELIRRKEELEEGLFSWL